MAEWAAAGVEGGDLEPARGDGVPTLASSSAIGSAQLATLSSHEERTLQEQIAALEERIELLEASNGVMVNLIRKVLRVLRIGGQTGREQTGS